MSKNKISILLSDISVEGDVVEKDKIILDAKVSGDVKADEVVTHSKSNIVGNIKSKIASLGGKLTGNVNSDKINIKKTLVKEEFVRANIVSKVQVNDDKVKSFYDKNQATFIKPETFKISHIYVTTPSADDGDALPAPAENTAKGS